MDRARCHRVLILLVAAVLVCPAVARAQSAAERADLMEASRLGRVLPAVVGILTEVGAEATIRCGKGPAKTVALEAVRENGTGFIIHPDGWIATNGHVVKPVYKDDEEHITTFLEQAAETACGPALKGLSAKQREQRLAAIKQAPANRQGVRLIKSLKVYLPEVSEQKGLPAVVKAYSPPIDPDLLPKGGGKPDPPMLDGAIIKVEATNLPVVRLAPNINQVYLGQPLFVVGYPGVVVWHPFISKKSRVEPSVTFGRVSALRLDVNERRVLQTDASISWGNSGGPAFNLRNEVIGLATFISTTLEGDEAIQGFNFLIPIDSIHALAKEVGLTPTPESPFMTVWNQAMDAIQDGRFKDALAFVDQATGILPGLLDVERVRIRLQERIKAGQ